MWYAPYFPAADCIPKSVNVNTMTPGDREVDFLAVFHILLRIVMTLLNIKKLPTTSDERTIKRALIWSGDCIYLDAGKADVSGIGAGVFPSGSYMGLFGGGQQGLDIFGYPRQGVAIGYNGFHANVNLYRPEYAGSSAIQSYAPTGIMPLGEPNAVMIYDNKEAFPPIIYIVQAARRISNMMAACDVAVENLKSPLIIGCEESQLKSVREAVDAVRTNRYAILTSKNFNLDNIQVWQTHMASDIPKAIWDQILSTFGWFLTTFGIDNNPNPEKKERQNITEVESNSQLLAINLQSRLASWQEGFDIVNELFGLDIEVEINQEVMDLVRTLSDARGDDDPDGMGDAVPGDDDGRRGEDV